MHLASWLAVPEDDSSTISTGLESQSRLHKESIHKRTRYDMRGRMRGRKVRLGFNAFFEQLVTRRSLERVYTDSPMAFRFHRQAMSDITCMRVLA